VAVQARLRDKYSDFAVRGHVHSLLPKLPFQPGID